MYSNIPSSAVYGVYISQLIRCARACSTYDQFLIRGSLLTNKLILQGFLQSRLQAAFRKFYGSYNDLRAGYGKHQYRPCPHAKIEVPPSSIFFGRNYLFITPIV
jgi:hypothetical protein